MTLPLLLLLFASSRSSLSRPSRAPPAAAPANRQNAPAPASAQRAGGADQAQPGRSQGMGASRSGIPGSERLSAALDAFQHAVKVGPQSAEAHNWLGVALAEKADLPAAIAEFRKAVALDPQYGRAYSNLGSTLAQSGDYAEAVKVFTQALALEPNSLGAHLNLGTALRETGDLEARWNTCARWRTPIRRMPPCSTSSGRRSGRAELATARSRPSSGRSRSIQRCARATTRWGPR